MAIASHDDDKYYNLSALKEKNIILTPNYESYTRIFHTLGSLNMINLNMIDRYGAFRYKDPSIYEGDYFISSNHFHDMFKRQFFNFLIMYCVIIVSILDYNFINKDDTFIFYFIHPHPWETHGSQSLGISTIDSAYFCKEGLCVKSTSSQYPKKYYIWPDYEIIHRVERFYKGINDNNIPDKNNDDLILNGQYKICRVNINERIFTDIEDLYCIDFNDDDEKISERLYIIKEGEKQSSLNDIFEVLPKRYLRSPSKTLYSYDSNRFYFKENFSLNEKRGCDIMLSNFFRLFDLHGFQKRDYMNKYNSDFETICDKIKRVIICNHVCIRHTNKFIRDYYSSLKFDFDIHEI